MESSVIHLPQSMIVQRPTMDAVVDTFRELLHLPPRHPQGFLAQGGDTFVETIIDHEGEGIGPINVSTDTPRFFTYAAKYEDNTTALMTIIGKSVSTTFRNGSTPRALQSIFRATLQHGPIVNHCLLNVVTPAVMHDTVEGYSVLQARTYLHQLIFDASKFEEVPVPQLTVSKVILRGWPEHGAQLPTCTFQTLMGDSLWMRLAWGKSFHESELFRLV